MPPDELCEVCLSQVPVDSEGNCQGTCHYPECPYGATFDTEDYEPLDFNREYDREYEPDE